jgi:hypothetical protein
MKLELWDRYGDYLLNTLLLRNRLEKVSGVEISNLKYNLNFFVSFTGREDLTFFVEPLSNLSAEFYYENLNLPNECYIVMDMLKYHKFSLVDGSDFEQSSLE